MLSCLKLSDTVSGGTESVTRRFIHGWSTMEIIQVFIYLFVCCCFGNLGNFKILFFFKDFYLFERDRENMSRGREIGTSRPPTEHGAQCRVPCGAQSQDPEITTWAKGRHLTNWATQASPFVSLTHFQTYIEHTLYYVLDTKTESIISPALKELRPSRWMEVLAKDTTQGAERLWQRCVGNTLGRVDRKGCWRGNSEVELTRQRKRNPKQKEKYMQKLRS